MNFGFDLYFEEEDINLIVLNGLNIKIKLYDFFFMKGNGYKKVIVELFKDDDFYFGDEKEQI